MWYIDIDWFLYIDPTLHSSDKSHLLLIYNPFLMFGFIEQGLLVFWGIGILVYRFPCDIYVWFWCQYSTGLIHGKCSLLFLFLKVVVKDCVNYSLNIDRIYQWSHLALGFWLPIQSLCLFKDLLGFSIFVGFFLSISSKLSILLAYSYW